MNIGKKLGTAAIIALGTLSTANAGKLVLDTFNYNTGVVDAENFVFIPVDTLTATVIDGTVITPKADVTYTIGLSTPTDDEVASATASTGSGNLVYGANNQADAQLSIEYSKGPLQGLIAAGIIPGLDFTAGGASDAFYFDVLEADIGFTVLFEVWSQDFGAAGTGYSSFLDTGILSVDLSSPETRTVAFTELVGSADLTSVYKTVLTISANGSSDFTIGEFGTIPEPTTVAIFGLGLLGFAASRRNKA